MTLGNSKIIIVVIAIAALGAFVMMKRKGAGGMPPSPPMPLTAPDDKLASEAAGDKFWKSNPLPGAATELKEPPGGGLSGINKNKAGVPITGGINFDKAGTFSPLEAGNCQCDDNYCYYYAPFHAKYGEQKGYGPARKSTRILYGDKVSACERLVAEHEMETYKYDQIKSRIARVMSSPSAARFVAARMARTGLLI